MADGGGGVPSRVVVGGGVGGGAEGIGVGGEGGEVRGDGGGDSRNADNADSHPPRPPPHRTRAGQSTSRHGASSGLRMQPGFQVILIFVKLLMTELSLDFSVATRSSWLWRRCSSGMSWAGRQLSFTQFSQLWGRNGVWASVSAVHRNFIPSAILRWPGLPAHAEDGWRVLDLCGGISTVLLAMARAHKKVSKYWLVEIDRDARLVGDNIIARVLRDFPHLVTSASLAEVQKLVQDVLQITEQMIIDLGRVDILCAAWPCTDLTPQWSER